VHPILLYKTINAVTMTTVVIPIKRPTDLEERPADPKEQRLTTLEERQTDSKEQNPTNPEEQRQVFVLLH
jgi:hypothetical protein